MALEIVWSKRAEKGFDKIVLYIDKKWTEKEVRNFIQETQTFIELLKKNPKILQPSGKMNLYRGPINKLTIVTYKIIPRRNQIVLVNIRSARQKPLK